MDNKPTVLDYLSQGFMIFGIAVLTLNIFCLLFGDSAQEISTIFTLGSAGLSVTTMLQFLLAIGITILFRFIFMTDILIKKMPLAVRVITMFAAAFLNIMVFVILCGWFPIDNLTAWIMFLISFAISCAVSTAVSLFKEKTENRKLAEALNKLKEEE
ncbi:MAG: hypothetical protein J1E39_10110 [Eubacterium sp.]|nr:hypothetical protein [Eubacterium sp.]